MLCTIEIKYNFRITISILKRSKIYTIKCLIEKARLKRNSLLLCPWKFMLTAAILGVLALMLCERRERCRLEYLGLNGQVNQRLLEIMLTAAILGVLTLILCDRYERCPLEYLGLNGQVNHRLLHCMTAKSLLWPHCTALHWAAIHYSVFHCTALHCTVRCRNIVIYTAKNCTALHNAQQNMSLLHYSALHSQPSAPIHCMFACWWLIALMSADRQTDRKTYRLTERQTGIYTYRQTDWQIDIQTVPFPWPELICSTIAGPVLLQLAKYCQNYFKLPHRPFYSRRGPPFLKRYKIKFFEGESFDGNVALGCRIFTSVETNKV